MRIRPADKAIGGQVVGPDGKPFSGATVILARSQPIFNGIGDDYVSQLKSGVFRETTGSDGRFGFPRQFELANDLKLEPGAFLDIDRN